MRWNNDIGQKGKMIKQCRVSGKNIRKNIRRGTHDKKIKSVFFSSREGDKLTKAKRIKQRKERRGMTVSG